MWLNTGSVEGQHERLQLGADRKLEAQGHIGVGNDLDLDIPSFPGEIGHHPGGEKL